MNHGLLYCGGELIDLDPILLLELAGFDFKPLLEVLVRVGGLVAVQQQLAQPRQVPKDLLV